MKILSKVLHDITFTADGPMTCRSNCVSVVKNNTDLYAHVGVIMVR